MYEISRDVEHVRAETTKTMLRTSCSTPPTTPLAYLIPPQHFVWCASHKDANVVWVTKCLDIPSQKHRCLGGDGSCLFQGTQQWDVGCVHNICRGVATQVVSWDIEIIDLVWCKGFVCADVHGYVDVRLWCVFPHIPSTIRSPCTLHARLRETRRQPSCDAFGIRMDPPPPVLGDATRCFLKPLHPLSYNQTHQYRFGALSHLIYVGDVEHVCLDEIKRIPGVVVALMPVCVDMGVCVDHRSSSHLNSLNNAHNIPHTSGGEEGCHIICSKICTCCDWETASFSRYVMIDTR